MVVIKSHNFLSLSSNFLATNHYIHHETKLQTVVWYLNMNQPIVNPCTKSLIHVVSRWATIQANCIIRMSNFHTHKNQSNNRLWTKIWEKTRILTRFFTCSFCYCTIHISNSHIEAFCFEQDQWKCQNA